MTNKLRYQVERDEPWREPCHKIPFIPFPKGWKVAPIPAFGGAVVRFLVKLPRIKNTKSIYLDFHNNLGYYGDPPEPYWEVHPYRGDVGRCDMADVKKLIRMIADTKDR